MKVKHPGFDIVKDVDPAGPWLAAGWQPVEAEPAPRRKAPTQAPRKRKTASTSAKTKPTT